MIRRLLTDALTRGPDISDTDKDPNTLLANAPDELAGWYRAPWRAKLLTEGRPLTEEIVELQYVRPDGLRLIITEEDGEWDLWMDEPGEPTFKTTYGWEPDLVLEEAIEHIQDWPAVGPDVDQPLFELSKMPNPDGWTLEEWGSHYSLSEVDTDVVRSVIYRFDRVDGVGPIVILCKPYNSPYKVMIRRADWGFKRTEYQSIEAALRAAEQARTEIAAQLLVDAAAEMDGSYNRIPQEVPDCVPSADQEPASEPEEEEEIPQPDGLRQIWPPADIFDNDSS